MEESTSQNACSTALQDIHAMVEQIKQDREVTLDYMKTSEWKQFLHDEGFSDGHDEGLDAGRNEERQKSILLMIQDYREEGISDERILQKLQKNYELSEEEARKYLE